MLVIVVFLLVLDIFSVPSMFGIQLHAEWVSAILDLCVGVLTIRLTFAIAKSQEKIESDKISSEKFFKLSFIRNYQKIEEKAGKRDLRLKIREFDNNIHNTIRIVSDVKVFILDDGEIVEKVEPLVLDVKHKEYAMEHVDAGADNECSENTNGFCYARFEILNDFDFGYFKTGRTYRFDLDIEATNIFGVEVRCRLSPWFKVEKKTGSEIVFSVTHNFGYYDSVKYVGA